MSTQPSGHPSAAHKMHHDTSAAATAELAFAGQANVFGIEVQNNSATAKVYLQVFDAEAAMDVTVGTTVPLYTLLCFENSMVRIDSQDPVLPNLNLGLVYAVTSGRTTNGAPAAAATVTFLYRKD